jgi:hypothetical protein
MEELYEFGRTQSSSSCCRGKTIGQSGFATGREGQKSFTELVTMAFLIVAAALKTEGKKLCFIRCC